MGLGRRPGVGTVCKHVTSEAERATWLVGHSGVAMILSDLVGPPTKGQRSGLVKGPDSGALQTKL